MDHSCFNLCRLLEVACKFLQEQRQILGLIGVYAHWLKQGLESFFKVTGQHEVQLTAFTVIQRDFSGEIFPSAVAQADVSIILSLAMLEQCHPVEESDRGNISEREVQHTGV